MFRAVALSVIREEENFLGNLGEPNKKGIFDVPELAIAYLISKEFIKLYPSHSWRRETKLDGYSGIADLIIDKSLIEFKLRDTKDKYLSDIKRMHEFQTSEINHKIFFLLCDVFDDSDERFQAINSLEYTEHIGDPIEAFSTHQSWYEKQIYCKVGIWKVE